MTNELPDNVLNPAAPAGTPPASAANAESLRFWCSHEVLWKYVGDVGGYLPMTLEPNEMHPWDKDIPGPGQLPALCQPPTGFDPKENPNAGPAAVARARLEVLRQRRRRR